MKFIILIYILRHNERVKMNITSLSPLFPNIGFNSKFSSLINVSLDKAMF